MSPVNILGLLGGVFFAYAAVPQAVRTIRAGRHLGTPVSIAVAIVAGTILSYSYLRLAHGFDWIITVNYSVEALSWAVLLFYAVFRRSSLLEGAMCPGHGDERVPLKHMSGQYWNCPIHGDYTEEYLRRFRPRAS